MKQGSLLFDGRFWPTFWTQFLGAFNDNVFKNALIILIIYKSYSMFGIPPEQMVFLCSGLFILPFFTFSNVAGQICDKYSKDRLMLLIKYWEVGVMVLGSIGFVTENIYILVASLFLMGTQSTFFGPVKYSILPQLIEEKELVEGNALVQSGTFVSILLGTILGGYLVGLEKGSVWVSIAVIVFAIIGSLTASKIHKLEPNDPEVKVEAFVLERMTFGYYWKILQSKDVLLGVIGISWFWFFGAAIMSLFPVYVKNVLYGDSSIVTLFLALFSIGMAMGSMVCEKISNKTLNLGLVPIGALGITLFTGDLYLIGEPKIIKAGIMHSLNTFFLLEDGWRIFIDLLLLSFFSGFYTVPLYTLIQQRSKKEVRSRVISVNNILNAFFMVASALILMYCYKIEMTIPQIFLLLAGLNILFAIILFSSSKEYFQRFAGMFKSKS